MQCASIHLGRAGEGVRAAQREHAVRVVVLDQPAAAGEVAGKSLGSAAAVLEGRAVGDGYGPGIAAAVQRASAADLERARADGRHAGVAVRSGKFEGIGTEFFDAKGGSHVDNVAAVGLRGGRGIAGIECDGGSACIGHRAAGLAAEATQQTADGAVAAGASGPFTRPADVDRQGGVGGGGDGTRGGHRDEFGELQGAGREGRSSEVGVGAAEFPRAAAGLDDFHRVSSTAIDQVSSKGADAGVATLQRQGLTRRERSAV